MGKVGKKEFIVCFFLEFFLLSLVQAYLFKKAQLNKTFNSCLL